MLAPSEDSNIGERKGGELQLLQNRSESDEIKTRLACCRFRGARPQLAGAAAGSGSGKKLHARFLFVKEALVINQIRTLQDAMHRPRIESAAQDCTN
jgi:hypothetical protein